VPSRGIHLKLDVDAGLRRRRFRRPERDLAELLLEIGEVAQVGRSGALFVIDEIACAPSTFT
jgi:hypothetical protein